MRSISISELKTIQLDILSAVDAFCKENSINYSLSDGTLIGAIRHKGYIPWDDDIDISMTREDYDKFEKLFPFELDDKYQLISLNRDNNWLRPYPIIVDNRTLMVEETREKAHGVGIDLFPVDDVPDDLEDCHRYLRRLKLLSQLRAIKLLKWRQGRSLINNLLLYLLKGCLFFISTKRLVRYCNRFAQINNGKNFSMCYQNSFGVYGKSPFSKSVFKDYIKVPFEDRHFMCFRNYDEYLCNTYGDYMTLPPIEEQCSTHSFVAFWK